VSTVDFPYVSGVTVGIKAKDTVILASEKLFSYSYFVFSKNVRKTVSLKEAAAKLLSRILFSRRYFPFLTQTIIGGVDETGPHLYGLDIIGSLIPDDYIAIGPGAEVAIGILENNYSKNMDISTAVELALSSIKSATKRSVGTGGGIDILKITKGKSEYQYIKL